MEKERMIAAREALEAKLQVIAQGGPEGSTELAKIANMPYDAELPVPEVIVEVAKTESVAKGEDYYYFAISPDGKVVTTISNGSLTNTNVTPGTEAELTFASFSSEVYNVYLEKLLEAKYDVIAQKTGDCNESLNRKEIRDVMAALFTAADTRNNNFCWDSGDSKIDFEKLVEMVRSVAKYGSKLVLISGGNVTTDLVLMDYSEDKNREVSVEKAGISKWIKIEELTYTHSTTAKVLDADYAILVAVADAANERSIHFVRRKVSTVDGSGQKERVVVVAGPMVSIDTANKWAYKVGMMEQYGVVVANTYPIASFYNAASYVDYSE